MTHAEATEAFQAYLEGHRRDPDEDLHEDLHRARKAMEIAWLEETTAAT